jgi:GNAT superfamily N-acetyltransferase
VEPGPADLLPDQHVTIGYFYVAPEQRRAGVGRGLFNAVREWANRQEGIAHIEMSVLAGDDQAVAFWRSLGFSPYVQRLWAGLSGADE